MSVLNSRKTYVMLAVFQAGPAVVCASGLPFVSKGLQHLGFPPSTRWLLAVVKAAAAIGLLSVTWFPGLARLTTAMLTLYMSLAVRAHIRADDRLVAAVPPALFMATFAAMTVIGPDQTTPQPKISVEDFQTVWAPAKHTGQERSRH